MGSLHTAMRKRKQQRHREVHRPAPGHEPDLHLRGRIGTQVSAVRDGAPCPFPILLDSWGQKEAFPFVNLFLVVLYYIALRSKEIWLLHDRCTVHFQRMQGRPGKKFEFSDSTSEITGALVPGERGEAHPCIHITVGNKTRFLGTLWSP